MSSKMGYDAIVAGTGIWGCTVARLLADSGKKVLVLERRQDIGGNCRCRIDKETGIEVHLYGSHIFHTKNRDVWEFVNRFVEFNGYQHKVLSNHNGRIFQLPIGINLISKFFGVELKPGEVRDFLKSENRWEKVSDAFIRGYTAKQWGIDSKEVDIGIVSRLKVRCDYNTNYFDDYWQGIPMEGYNELFRRMLDSPNITLVCGIGFALKNHTSFPPVYYSGALDELFDYCFGELPWRSLRFEEKKLDLPDFQGTAVVNYPDANVGYTRIHEFRHYHPEPVGKLSQVEIDSGKTIVSFEYPEKWSRSREPFYPITNRESNALAKKYRQEAEKYPWLIIGGRLGSYRYLDMDQTVADAMRCVSEN